jgi:hypothetical protein
LLQVDVSNYYPQGSNLPGLTYNSSIGGRYGYQGQFAENDKEINEQFFELRILDLINSKNMKIKLMVVADDQKEILWDMLTETEIPLSNLVYQKLGQYIDLDAWRQDYLIRYKEWLESDAPTIYDINSSINTKIIYAISNYNKVIQDRIYFWFDVDRSINPDYKWEICPISHEKLIRLTESYHSNNRLISSKAPLVFPDVE